MVIQKHEFYVFADYFQFYLQDESVDGDLVDIWDAVAVERLFALTLGTIAVGTVRNMDVPVVVEIHDHRIGVVDDALED